MNAIDAYQEYTSRLLCIKDTFREFGLPWNGPLWSSHLSDCHLEKKKVVFNDSLGLKYRLGNTDWCCPTLHKGCLSPTHRCLVWTLHGNFLAKLDLTRIY